MKLEQMSHSLSLYRVYAFAVISFLAFGFVPTATTYAASLGQTTPISPTSITDTVQIDSGDLPSQALTVLRDGSWQFVGAMLTIVSIVVAIWIYRGQSRKALQYGVLSRELVARSPSVARRIQIVANGETLNSPRLVLLKVINSGNLPIPADNYEHPLIAHVGGRIVDCELSNTAPEELRTYVKWTQDEDNRLKFDKFLLNQGDWFELQMLVSMDSCSSQPSTSLEGRIAGVKHLERKLYEQIHDDSNVVKNVLIYSAIVSPLVAAFIIYLIAIDFPLLPLYHALYYNQDVRIGFIWGMGLTLCAFALSQTLYHLHRRWLKVMQYLSPVK